MTSTDNGQTITLSPAKNLDEVQDVFDTTMDVRLHSGFYVPRDDDGLKKLTAKLKNNSYNKRFHGFLCGHVGSGKTTELLRLAADKRINELYFPLFISAQSLQIDNVNLTHDAVLVGMGLALIADQRISLDPKYAEELNNWGKSLVKTFNKTKSVAAEIGAKPTAWVVWFKTLLKYRSEWKQEEKQALDPKVLDLIDILNRMAQEVKNLSGKNLLVMIDDLEKGSSDAEKQMHRRLFTEYYSELTQPRFNIIYTLPVYFKALPGRRIEKQLIYSFSAVRIYQQADKKAQVPPLDKQSPGYKLVNHFIHQRLADPQMLFADGVLDELIRIGGGLFRDTDAAIADAAYYAIDRGAAQVSMTDAKKAFDSLKKDYQPSIRGDAITILSKVTSQESGWVNDVEPFLQSGAVVEYENGNVWLDVRYVLKAYLQSLLDAQNPPTEIIQ